MNLDISLVILFLWAAWGLYWFISARGNKAVRRRESVLSRLAHLGPLALAGALLAVPRLPGAFGAQLPGAGLTLALLGTVLVAAGLGYTVWARRVLAGNWSATVTLKVGHELVRSGPYRRIRHPIYTGLILAFAGTALARGTPGAWLAVLIVFGALWRKLKLEERWLGEAFGPPYERYRRETWALIPYLL